MTFTTLVTRYGKTDSAIARGLKVSRQLVAYWRRKGISPQRQAWIREKMRGRK